MRREYDDVLVVMEYMQVAFVPKRIIFRHQPCVLEDREEIWDWESVKREWNWVNSLDDLLSPRLYEDA